MDSLKGFKEIPGVPGYFVSKVGVIVATRRRIRVRKLKLNKRGRGYYSFNFFNGTKVKEMSVHTAVLLAWYGPKPEGFCCNHINGDTKDNRVENLEWISRADNERHARKFLGKDLRGERNVISKLDDKKVREIRRRKLSGETFDSIAKDYGVHKSCIAKAVYRESWAHVE